MAAPHPFHAHPHRTTLALAVPVLLSLIAEPLTSLVDTAYIARLGVAPQAALGVAAILLSGTYWIFNFLAIATQTKVAHLRGRDEDPAPAVATALTASAACGLLLAVLLAVFAWPLAEAMDAKPGVAAPAVSYLRIRLLAAPAVLLMYTAAAALRGTQDMKTPMVAAVGLNVINLALDPILIFGWGPVPALGLAGAAWASTAAQWAGALWLVVRCARTFGLRAPSREGLGDLFRVGPDMIVRTASLTLFLLLATRVATAAGEVPAAAYQGMRSVWLFTALFLDAFATVAQSLIGQFHGGGERAAARRAAGVCVLWSVTAGVLLAAAMLAATGPCADLLAADRAREAFVSVWWIAALSQPLGALPFATDGIHWGTGDWRYLRQAMLVSSALGIAGLLLIDPGSPGALAAIWWVTCGWLLVRSMFGVLRVWPRGSGPWE